MTTNTSTQTANRLFNRMTSDDRWLGFGYLGGRLGFLTSDDPEAPARPDLVADADEAILERVKDEGWTYEDLFTWANSKDGRWFADMALGCDDLRGAMRYLRKQGR